MDNYKRELLNERNLKLLKALRLFDDDFFCFGF